MFENQYTITGRIKFREYKETSNGNKVLNATLSRGSKEKGYENYKIRAFKDNATELNFLDDNEAITIKGWISQDNWEKDGQKFSKVIFNVKEWEAYTEENKPTTKEF